LRGAVIFNMKKKRILAVVTALMLMAQMCPFNTVLAGENAQKSIEVLRKIGVISEEDIQNPAQEVNRAKFTYYAAKAFGRIDVEDKYYFKDLPVEHWANPHVSALVEMGVVDLAEDGLFNPDLPVTPEQAYKIMLVGLGYEKAQDMVSYNTAALKAEILISTEKQTSLTLAEAAEIIYNAMNVETPNLLLYGKDYTAENLDETMLMQIHNLFEEEGVVTAVYGTSLSGEYEVRDENSVYIDGNFYKLESDVNFEELLGRHVNFVYREDSQDELTVIYAESLNDEFIEIESDLIKGFDNDDYSLKYYKSSDTTRASSFKFSDGVKVIYNGKPYTGRLSTALNEFVNGTKHGKVTIIKKHRLQEETVIIKSYRTVVAKNYSETNEVFFDYYSPADNFDFSEADIIRYITPDGTKVPMPNAFVSVLDVAESEDGELIEVIVCDKQARGTLSSVYTEDDTVVEIGDTRYEITDTAWNKFAVAIKLGTEVTAWFDSSGHIVYMEASSNGDMQSGYLKKVLAIEDDDGINYVFEVFSNGTMSKLELAERVVLDEASYKMTDYKQFFLKFPQVSEITEDKIKVEPQVIRYKLNNEGKITKLDTTLLGQNEDEDKTLKLVHDAGEDTSKSLIYVSGLKRFGMNYLYDSSYTDIFVLPKGIEDGEITISGNKVSVDDSMYSSSKSFTSLTSHYLKIYDCDADNSFAEIIVAEETPVVNQMNIFMFDRLSRVLDDDEMVATALECFCETGEKRILIDESLEAVANTLKKGDIIVIDTDLQGKKAYRIEKYFNAETLEFNDGDNRNTSNPYWYRGTYNPYGDSFIVTARVKIRNITKGYAYNINNGVLEVMYEFDGNVSERINAPSVPVIVYDKNVKKGVISMGTLTDIDTYKTTGDADLVVTGYYSEAAKCIFVYK